MIQISAKAWRPLLMLSLVAIGTMAPARELAIWELNALVRTAVEQHPSVLNAQRLVDAAQADEAYAERQRWPELTVNSVAQSDQTTAAVVVRQPLWAGGAIEAGEEVSRAALAVSQATAQEQQLTIGLRVLEAWRNYALSAEQITIVDQGIEQLRDLVAMIQRRVDARISPRVELDLAQARVIQVQITRASLEAERDLAIKRLQELVGAPIVTRAPPGEAPVAQWLEAIHKPVSLPTGVEQEQVAREQPTVRRVREEATLAQREIRQIEALQWPSLYLQYQQGVNQALTNDKRLGLALEYTPGRGFSTRQQVQGAVARAQARDINVQTAIRDARDSLNAKLQEMSRSRALERSWVPSVGASEKLLASYQRQFIAGRKSWQDVLSQQNELTQARQALVDARVRWLSAYAELQLMSASARGGGLPSADWLAAVAPTETVRAGLASGTGLKPAAPAATEAEMKPASPEVSALNVQAEPMALGQALAPKPSKPSKAPEPQPVVGMRSSQAKGPESELGKPAGGLAAAAAPLVTPANSVDMQPLALDSRPVQSPTTTPRAEPLSPEPGLIAIALVPAVKAIEPESDPGALGLDAVAAPAPAVALPKDQDASARTTGILTSAPHSATRPNAAPESSSNAVPTVVVTPGAPPGQDQGDRAPQVWAAEALFVDGEAVSPRLSPAGAARLQAWADAAQAGGQEVLTLSLNAYSDPPADSAEGTQRAKAMAMSVSTALRRFGMKAQQWRVRWHGLASAAAMPCAEAQATAAQAACQSPSRRVELRVDWAPVTAAQLKN